MPCLSYIAGDKDFINQVEEIRIGAIPHDLTDFLLYHFYADGVHSDFLPFS